MARAFTEEQALLLRSGSVKLRTLVSFWLDSGTYNFCDDIQPLYLDEEVYIGAAALFDISPIRSGTGMAAESVTITLDGTRMQQSGITDPAEVLRTFFDEDFHQRRVNISLAILAVDGWNIALNIPVYAGKINNAKLVDSGLSLTDTAASATSLVIEVDSLASRYNRVTYRTRSDGDQKEIDPTDDFFKYTADVQNNEKALYWGKKTPAANAQVPSATLNYRINQRVGLGQ